MTLKHLPFWEALAEHEDESPIARTITAGFMTLRLIDHTVLAGPEMIKHDSVSVANIRRLITELPADHPHKRVLQSIINQMQLTRHGDVRPVLPTVLEYAKLLGKEKWGKPLAKDIRKTVREYR
jgi:hypothetical protein